jgi:ferritin
MLISQKMNTAINEQIGREFGASHQYVSIAAHFDAENLSALAKHFYRQAEEERDHAMRFVRYLVDAGAKVAIPVVAAPKPEFSSAEEAVKLSVRWEKDVTKQIHALADLAMKESDHTTFNFLQWFVAEQLEEVSSMEKLLSIVQRAGEGGLLTVDLYLHESSEREEAS